MKHLPGVGFTVENFDRIFVAEIQNNWILVDSYWVERKDMQDLCRQLLGGEEGYASG